MSNSKRIHKKGYQTGDLLSFTIIFLVTAIALGLGADVLLDFQDTQTNNAGTITNETITWATNNTAIKLDQRSLSSIDSVYHNNTLVNAGRNYTTDLTGGTITLLNETGSIANAAGGESYAGNYNVTYSYTYGSTARNATGYGLDSQQTFSKWLPTLALIIIIAIIIGILLTYLASRLN